MSPEPAPVPTREKSFFIKYLKNAYFFIFFIATKNNNYIIKKVQISKIIIINMFLKSNNILK